MILRIVHTSVVLVVLIVFVCPCFAQGKPEPIPADTPLPGVELKSTTDKVSYAIGMNIGRSLKQQGMEVDLKLVTAGIMAVLAGEEPALSDADVAAAFQAYQAEKAAGNKDAAEKFLAENGKKDGVQTTKSGLQYMVLKQGDGDAPKTSSRVSTHYRGRLLNGTVFDQSYQGAAPSEQDEPVTFGVTQVIKGWTEALQLMKAGSSYRLFIHPDLAYGESAPPSIGPNSLLIFDIHLIGVTN